MKVNHKREENRNIIIDNRRKYDSNRIFAKKIKDLETRLKDMRIKADNSRAISGNYIEMKRDMDKKLAEEKKINLNLAKELKTKAREVGRKNAMIANQG